MEMLPSVPDWKSKKISLMGYPTSEPMYLFYRDALECVEYVFGNPLFANHMDFSPVRLYQDAEHTIRVYSEWMTGDAAWDMQVSFVLLFPRPLSYFHGIDDAHSQHSQMVQPFSGSCSHRTKPISR